MSQSTPASTITEPIRICVLDPHPSQCMFLGKCVVRMFQEANTIPDVHIELFHVRTNLWPIEPNKRGPVESYWNRYQNYRKGHNPPVEEIVSYIQTNFDGLVVGGSCDSVMDSKLPYLDTLIAVTQQVVNAGFPFFGICFGAQVLAAAMYGRSVMRKMDKKEYGFKTFTVLDQSNPIFKHIPLNFANSSVHEDCFEGEELKTICCSKAWKNNAFQVKDKPAWGLQFHPEFLESDVMGTFECEEKYGGCVEHDEKTTDDSVGAQLSQNFVSICESLKNKTKDL